MEHFYRDPILAEAAGPLIRTAAALRTAGADEPQATGSNKVWKKVNFLGNLTLRLPKKLTLKLTSKSRLDK